LKGWHSSAFGGKEEGKGGRSNQSKGKTGDGSEIRGTKNKTYKQGMETSI